MSGKTAVQTWSKRSIHALPIGIRRVRGRAGTGIHKVLLSFSGVNQDFDFTPYRISGFLASKLGRGIPKTVFSNLLGVGRN
jgi:hypothetical protein